MLLNYVKLFFRQLLQNPFFVIINVVGLSIGYASFLVLWTYTQAELQADQFQEDHERIYRLHMRGKYFEYAPIDLAMGEPAVVKQLASDFDEIEDYTRVFHFGNLTRAYVPDHGPKAFFLYTNRHGDPVTFEEPKSAYVDPNFIEFFSLRMIEGSAKTCLVKPFTVLLSERAAEKYFGRETALGNTVLLDGKIALTVTGIFKNMPRNSHLDLDLLISTASIERTISQIILTSGGPFCYIRIQPGVSPTLLEKKIKPVAAKLDEAIIQQCGDCTLEYRLQPLSEIYFSNNFSFDLHESRSRVTLTFLAAVSLMILAMGWINYSSLVTAFQRKRSKALLVRRSMGALPKDFSAQYLVESGIVNLLALLAAITIIQLIGPNLQQEFGFYIPDWRFLSTHSIPVILVIVTLAILGTGLYTAFVASRSIRSGPVVEGTVSKMPVGAIHFSFALVLIIVMTVISEQVKFVSSLDVGFSKENVLVLDLSLNDPANLEKAISSLRNQLSALEGVTGVSVSANSFEETPELVLRQSGNPISPKTCGGIDEEFFPLYNIRLAAGRNFIAGHPSDHKSIILSRRAAQMLGYATPMEAIGKKVSIEKSEWTLDFEEVEIIGVTENIRIKPFFKGERDGHGVAFTSRMHLSTIATQPRKISVRINPERFMQTMSQVERTLRNALPGEQVSSYLLQERLTLAYGQEDIIWKKLAVASGIAISIACLGLLGMVVNRAESKTKEMGIRKILGAGATQLASLLMHSVLRQTWLALFLAIPIAIYFGQQYLEKFTERISITWWHIALPLMLVLLIVVMTISRTLWKAVRANPVEALKHE
jgi:putative ABC transport system permease protein